MPRRGIIAVGASAGGLEPLTQLVRALPADLPAAVFVVLHVSPYAPSHLPAILARQARLRVAHAQDGEEISPGRIYVAPPDRHMLIRDGTVELHRGPRENRARPAIDPLFRSAARSYGPRVAGVVLSGALRDGSMGLMAIRARGGLAIVQDPEEAPFASMPRTAIEYAAVDHVLPVAEIGLRLARLAREEAPEKEVIGMTTHGERAPDLIQRDLEDQAADRRNGKPALYSCPDCGGVLWQMADEKLIQFNCHVGHTFSPDNLLIQMSEGLENALWSCVRTLREKATLTLQMAARARGEGNEEFALRLEEQAQVDEEHIRIIRETLLETPANPTSQPIVIDPAEEKANPSGQD